MNDLQKAACIGSAERTLSVLARGVIDIDEGGNEGVTALMFASMARHARIVRMLLNTGANAGLAADDSFTALLASAHKGHVAVATMLLNAVADVQEATDHGDTALHWQRAEGTQVWWKS